VLELVSNSAAAGKTQLLYLLIASVLLPPSPVSFDTRQNTPPKPAGAVVVIDTDNRFEVERLAQIVSSRHSAASTTSDNAGDNQYPHIVLHALQHVHILRPQSLASFLATLQQLPEYLLGLKQHSSPHRPLSLLVIDSMTAFYWTERSEQEMTHLSSDGHERHQQYDRNPYSDVVSAIKHLQLTFGCPIVATSWSLSDSKANPSGSSMVTANPPPSARPLLPGVWNSCVTARLLVFRESVRKFPPGLSTEHAERDRGQRQEVVNRSRFRADVDWWGSEGWPEALKEGLRKDASLRAFGFVIQEEGASIDEGYP